MRFASLGSGSRGNCTLVEAGRTRLLIDCGFSTRATLTRLGRLGVAAEDIDAILVTHEHGDHIGGVFGFAKRFGVPVHLTQGTFAACAQAVPDTAICRVFDSHAPFAIGDLQIFPFPVPHDAREPAQFVFSDGARRFGVLTDAGSVTSHMLEMLEVCDSLLLECNHDLGLLNASSYPAMLKRRISGEFGHLSNDQAASLLARVETRRLQHVVAAHLSAENNRRELATAALSAALGCAAEWVAVASQEEGTGWRELI